MYLCTQSSLSLLDLGDKPRQPVVKHRKHNNNTEHGAANDAKGDAHLVGLREPTVLGLVLIYERRRRAALAGNGVAVKRIVAALIAADVQNDLNFANALNFEVIRATGCRHRAGEAHEKPKDTDLLALLLDVV